MKWLKAQGANIYAQNDAGETPHHVADLGSAASEWLKNDGRE